MVNLETFLLVLKDIQYFLEPACFLIAILFINQKYHGTNFRNRPLLHKFLLIGLFGWLIYTIMDVILWELAWDSIPIESAPGVYSGYPSEYPKLLIANILRDFGALGGMIMNWSFLIASYCIKWGESKTKKIFWENKVVRYFVILFTLVLVAGDQVSVTIWEDGSLSASSLTVGLGLIFVLSGLIFYFIAAILLIQSLIQAGKEDRDLSFKKKLRVLSLGILFMGIGHVYWIIYSQIGNAFPDWTAQTIVWVSFSLIGHLLWMCSPICISIALKSEKSQIIDQK
jgi:hypothetical protein